ncbi:protein ABHD11-like isoform X2 [Uloborus diversus]|nr:protein ABHD11-like isoform X2 [Uloborus diversus]XP_054708417.1 protein ABHD11-like isoform X2 [Uloborus diversus]
MKISGALLLFFLLKFTECGPVRNHNVQAVDLDYFCMRQISTPENEKLAPIILLHGLGSTKEGWDGAYQLLAVHTKRKVCVPDLRNHGSSPYSKEADVEAMAADIVRMIGSLNTDKAILLGHSLGGKVAVHVALNHPDKVEKLIVEDMRPNGITPVVLKQIKGFMQLVRAGVASIPEGLTEHEAKVHFVKFILEKTKQMNVSTDLTVNEADRIPIRCTDGKCSFRVNVELFQKVIKDPESFLTHSEGVYKGPALFIYGTKSPFKVGEDEANIHKLFPKAKLVPVEGAGHIIHLKHDKFWDETIKFIISDS